MNRFLRITVIVGLASALLGCAAFEPSPPEGQRARVHEVQAGETLSEIAMKYYGTYKKFGTLAALKSANDIRDAQELRVGQRLRIPPVRVDGQWRPSGAGASALRRPETPEPRVPEVSATPTDTHHARGIQALRDENYDAAVASLTRARRANPDDFQVRRDLATARYQQSVRRYEAGGLVAAREGFEAVLALRPDCQECRAYLGEIDDRSEEWLEEGKSRYAAGRFERAAELLERSVQLNPHREPALEYRFRAYFDLALERFSRFQDSGRAAYREAAEKARAAARRTGHNCAACEAYADEVKKRLYNDGIRRFTEKGSEQMEKAIRVWERVQFMDSNYRDVAENIRQAEGLLKKLREI